MNKDLRKILLCPFGDYELQERLQLGTVERPSQSRAHLLENASAIRIKGQPRHGGGSLQDALNASGRVSPELHPTCLSL
ncbi:hypothetical protein NPIL_664641 [Nephila pilipes]|uniref:Uncharacterized protein n=1 Tax=Nephila pilipes TaxID=299642 RepID=A0A8X6UB59_NEPPI|nr:hypothetical protein NPIL_664641 [Nephila pilipes]